MKRRPGIWSVGFLPLLVGCLHAAMIGGMGLGMGMMQHRRGTANCRREASAMERHLREDLDHLRQLETPALGAFMPEHRARLRAFLNALAPAKEEHSS